MKIYLLAAVAALAVAQPAHAQRSQYDSLIESHAAAHGLPPELVHRVVVRES